MKRLSERVHDLAAAHPRGAEALVTVFADPFDAWPLPWYLRDMPRVGYYTEQRPPERFGSITVTSDDYADRYYDALIRPTHYPYTSPREPASFELRPRIYLRLFAADALWRRYLERRRAAEAP